MANASPWPGYTILAPSSMTLRILAACSSSSSTMEPGRGPRLPFSRRSPQKRSPSDVRIEMIPLSAPACARPARSPRMPRALAALDRDVGLELVGGLEPCQEPPILARRRLPGDMFDRVSVRSPPVTAGTSSGCMAILVLNAFFKSRSCLCDRCRHAWAR